MQNESENQYFCLLPVTNSTDFAIYIALTALSLPLVLFGFSKFCKIRGAHNKSTTFVYSVLLLWWLTFVGSNVYAILLYRYHEDDPARYSSDQMSQLSKYAFIGDWTSTFIIQLLLIYVPYRWCKNITVLFNGNIEQERANSRGSEAFVTTKYTGIETKVYPFLKFYIWVRFLELGLPIAILLLDKIQLIFQIMMFCLLADCLIVSFSLLLGMISIKTSPFLTESIDEDEATRMFNQYLVISAASLVRFGFDIYTFILTINNSAFSAQCPGEGEGDGILFRIIFMLAICLCGDFFPIFIILRIYTLEEQPEQICKSLIITTATANTSSIKLKD